MSDRIVDISDHAAYVQVRMGHLEISGDEIGRERIPIGDLGAVVLANPGVLVSQNALAQLAEAGICVIASDAKRQPVGMLLPLASHSTQSERFAKQASLSLPRKKRLWQQLVKAKIAAQARLLSTLHGRDCGLSALAVRVRSGDPDNLEAQAARRYWPVIFSNRSFRRRRDGGGINAALNYGYAVLGSMTARALAGSGLHPSLGLSHHNRYDAFCLARDLMEPFRPIVDLSAHGLLGDLGEECTQRLSIDQRRHLLEALGARYEYVGESRTLFDWIGKSAASVARVVEGGEPRLMIAEI